MLTEMYSNKSVNSKIFLVGLVFVFFPEACDVVIDVILHKELIHSAMAYI